MKGDAGDVLSQHALVVDLGGVVLSLVPFRHEKKPENILISLNDKLRR